jgi:hypothetical protein
MGEGRPQRFRYRQNKILWIHKPVAFRQIPIQQELTRLLIRQGVKDFGSESDAGRASTFARKHEEGLRLERFVGDLDCIVAEIFSVFEKDG